MNRPTSLQQLAAQTTPWDIAIIGGGATGMGIAVDAASRGYSVILLEQHDFGKGTSSRSTKLVHGGVRYLQQGNISLVMEALKERGLLLRNAPHLVHDLAFIVPNYAWWETPFYGIGMKIYDMLAGKYGFGPSQILSRDEVLEKIPTLETDGLRGGVKYHDGQFDDSRLLINLAQTAVEQGACLINYARVTGFTKDEGYYLNGLTFTDQESGTTHTIQAKSIINATGPFCDAVRKMDDTKATDIISPSQGVHIVLSRDFLPGNTAIMVPHTRDGRVMFAIPWHGHALVGTTDTAITDTPLEPLALDEEITFILETASSYLAKDPTRDDILSVFTGIRPLVKAGDANNTAALSRDHTIHIASSGLLTIAGGKWTTYRKMAEDAVDHAIVLAHIEERPCITKDLHLHGFHQHSANFGELSYYGSDARSIEQLIRDNPDLGKPLHPDLPIVAAQVIWAARHEMARTVEDFLARRTRALFLNSKASQSMAPEVARLLAQELHQDETWQQLQLADFEKTLVAFQAPKAN
ncbi:glycerol-3-phosphate dehydrogenase/oxidase [Phragmitibacter flavus]|uniref:Glycerol-3-phosphate dehydrogenase/oxidase n=1 Tax=Phragmitibacter flavus TaxID=2576071 RepID=A0A5R8KD94_9BACT|nr:glycerol-3-phosphate dehydrogenase/oxidase [Phragmitibacter flavus]TLD70270.1 glycerol-3-phosphate dehydrogenase/oxidase [Phragmitibacter flavus]